MYFIDIHHEDRTKYGLTIIKSNWEVCTFAWKSSQDSFKFIDNNFEQKIKYKQETELCRKREITK